MDNFEKTQLFERTSIPKAVMTLAIPTICSQLISMIYNLADTFFVCRLNDPNQAAAVTLAFPAFLALNAITNLFGIGGSSATSRYLGEKKYEKAKDTSAFSLYFGLLAVSVYSIVIAIFSPQVVKLLGGTASTDLYTAEYIKWVLIIGGIPTVFNVMMGSLVRAEGRANQASIGVMLGGVMNIILDPIFIFPFGFNLGVVGAAIATMLSNVIASMYFIILIVRNRHRMYISLNPIRVWSALKSDIPGRVISIGIPASVQNILVTTSAMLMNNLAVPFGAAAVAAMGIAKKIDMIPMYISMGLGQGIMPLVGYCYASKDYHRMKKTVLFTAKLAVGVSVTLVAAIELLSPNIVELFIMDSATVAYGTDFLRVFCIATIFMSINMLMISVFQATGQGRGALVLAVIRKAVLEIPLLFLLDRLFPLYGIVWVQTIVELLVLPVSLLLYRHFIDGLPHAGSV